MKARQAAAIVTLLAGTGYALGVLISTAFPAVPLWASWPMGAVLTFKLVMEAGRP